MNCCCMLGSFTWRHVTNGAGLQTVHPLHGLCSSLYFPVIFIVCLDFPQVMQRTQCKCCHVLNGWLILCGSVSPKTCNMCMQHTQCKCCSVLNSWLIPCGWGDVRATHSVNVAVYWTVGHYCVAGIVPKHVTCACDTQCKCCSMLNGWLIMCGWSSPKTCNMRMRQCKCCSMLNGWLIMCVAGLVPKHVTHTVWLLQVWSLNNESIIWWG